ncbi:OmpA family protein [Aquabacter sp. L1I39]|uniref:OmpA family protein n=1 Tax=Aquabacter sp. L1I39 TaxID=2820278 RepID=UPI001ADC7464|nr:OmpA family protein [Aquabacter sp. L1I39]QTL05642.1 OmpA family protein [Aquabacter sp. L1I39]
MSHFLRAAGRTASALVVALALAGPAAAQTATSYSQIIQGLNAVTTDSPTVDAQALRAWAAASAKQGGPTNSVSQSDLVKKLFSLAQITVQIQFALNSDIIRPESYAAIGAIADAMHDPILRGYRFAVVGNTDATGTRAYNLKLSQERADAIVQALVNLYRVSPARLEAIGLGQEALQNPSKPDDPINRRVQIFNIGPVGQAR